MKLNIIEPPDIQVEFKVLPQDSACHKGIWGYDEHSLYQPGHGVYKKLGIGWTMKVTGFASKFVLKETCP